MKSLLDESAIVCFIKQTNRHLIGQHEKNLDTKAPSISVPPAKLTESSMTGRGSAPRHNIFQALFLPFIYAKKELEQQAYTCILFADA